jgi:hypothetical protein
MGAPLTCTGIDPSSGKFSATRTHRRLLPRHPPSARSLNTSKPTGTTAP